MVKHKIFEKAVAIIPARGGSKRLPGKNLYTILGKPMLGWVIETVLSTHLFCRVIVSSEDENILSVTRSFGAEGYKRPDSLADDFTHVGPVIDDCLSALNINPHSICLLYATALLLRKEHLLQAFEILKDPDIGSVLSIAEFESPIQRAYEIKDNQGIAMVQPEYFGHRSQDLPLRYRDIGLFYWWKKNSLELKKFGMVMPKSCAVDIDTIEDLEVAKALFEYNFKTQADFGWY